MNKQILTAADYHRATSYLRHGLTPHTLDWAHRPVADKRYPELPRVVLDRSAKLPPIDYFDLVNRYRTIDTSRPEPLDCKKISTVFSLTHDITARSVQTDPPFYYRSVASAGALYPFELYLAVHDIDGVDSGVYHYHLFDFSLTALSLNPVPDIPPVDHGISATFYITGIFFRSAWKYRNRAYRYVLLDAGHLLDNLRLALDALDLSFSIHLDFDDEKAANLLGLDSQQEVCLACVHLFGGNAGEKRPGDTIGPKSLSGKIFQASTVSEKEIVYPDILKVHRAGNIVDNRSVDTLPALDVLVNQPTAFIDLKPPDHPRSEDYSRVLWQRRSRRNFISGPVSRDKFMTFVDLMARNTGPVSAMPPVCRSALTTGFLVGMGMPVPPGFYVLDPDAKRLGRVFGGRFAEPMAEACLDQMWLKSAGLHLLFMTDLAALDRTWGARGYRYAMIEAGHLGQQAYLAATALGWGACGIGAIYDREAADLLELTDDGALLYLVAAGPVKRR